MQFSTDEGNSGGSAKAASNEAADNSELVKSQANQAKIFNKPPLTREQFIKKVREQLKSKSLTLESFSRLSRRRDLPELANQMNCAVKRLDFSNENLEGFNYDLDLHNELFPSSNHGSRIIRATRDPAIVLNFRNANLKNSKWVIDVAQNEDFIPKFCIGNLTKANLQGASFTNLSFLKSTFYKNNLKDARFRNIVFRDTKFLKTQLDSVSFTFCRFFKSQFPESSFAGANLLRTSFIDSHVPCSTSFENGDLDNVTIDFDLSQHKTDGARINNLGGFNTIDKFSLEQLAKLNLEGPELVSYQFNLQIIEAIKKAKETGQKQLIDFSGQDLSRAKFSIRKLATEVLGDYSQSPEYRAAIIQESRRLYRHVEQGYLRLAMPFMFNASGALEEAARNVLNSLKNDGSIESLRRLIERERIQSPDIRGRLGEILGSVKDLALLDLLKKYPIEFNFTDTDLSYTDLSFLFAESADFSAANLQNSFLEGAQIETANFHGANLISSSFRRATMPAANFANASLPLFDAICADLPSAKFVDARLLRSIFYGTNFEGADFSGASFAFDEEVGAQALCEAGDDTRTQFNLANIDRANFAGCNLENVEFRNIDSLAHANFSGALLPVLSIPEADLTMANFEGARLDHADFREARLRGTNFKDASLRFVDFSKARIDQNTDTSIVQTDFSGADLSSAKIKGKELMRAKVEGLNYYKAKLGHNTYKKKLKDAGARSDRTALTPFNMRHVGGLQAVIRDYGIRGSDLRDKTLSSKNYIGENMSDVNFSRSTLASCNLERAKVVNVNFENAIIRNAKFTGALLDGCNFDQTNFQAHNSFTNAVLRNLDFTYAQNFHHAHFQNTRFFNVKFPAGFNLEDAIRLGQLVETTEADLTGLDFKHFEMSHFNNADDVNANPVFDLRGSDLRGAILAGFNLGNCHIDGTSKFDETTNFHRAVAVPRFLASKFGAGQRFTIKGQR